MNYQNNINTYADLTAYNADKNKDYPNVSYISGTDEVKWADRDETLLIAIYDVNDTSSATKLTNTTYNIASMKIDGVIQPSVVSTYTFGTTGEHKVVFELTDSTILPTFAGTPTLKKLIIPNSVTNIGNGFLRRTISLIELTIPDNVTSVGMDLLENGDTNPSGGVKKIYIGRESVIIKNTSYYQGIFGISGLRRCNEIVVSPDNTTYDSRNNCNALIETSTNTLIAGAANTVIPNSVTTIGDYAFYNNFNLTTITIPNSVTTIGKRAFQNCRLLTNIIIGSGVTSIDDYAFVFESKNTQYKKTVTIYATTPPSLGMGIFNNNNLTTIYVPSESVDAYKAASRWSSYASKIQAIPTT